MCVRWTCEASFTRYQLRNHSTVMPVAVMRLPAYHAQCRVPLCLDEKRQLVLAPREQTSLLLQEQPRGKIEEVVSAGDKRSNRDGSGVRSASSQESIALLNICELGSCKETVFPLPVAVHDFAEETATRTKGKSRLSLSLYSV